MAQGSLNNIKRRHSVNFMQRLHVLHMFMASSERSNKQMSANCVIKYVWVCYLNQNYLLYCENFLKKSVEKWVLRHKWQNKFGFTNWAYCFLYCEATWLCESQGNVCIKNYERYLVLYLLQVGKIAFKSSELLTTRQLGVKMCRIKLWAHRYAQIKIWCTIDKLSVI